jgi:hypothetical protein
MIIPKKPIKAYAVIIDVIAFPKSCVECVFCSKSRCIPQGIYSTISVSNRPECCPLRTAYAYEMGKAGGK